MKLSFIRKLKSIIGNLKINRKIQLSLLVIIIPFFIMSVMTFVTIYRYNQKYDVIISNTSEAGRFSIKFKEEFDYKIYLLISGHSNFSDEDPYKNIELAVQIANDLKENTNISQNKNRADSILRLLNNLKKYVNRIEENKKSIGHYDENISIWENDIQLVTALIQNTMLEYTYYETRGMEEVRVIVSDNLDRITLICLIIFIVLVITAIILSLVIPNSIVKPIYHLIDVTNRVAKGDLSARASFVGGGEVEKLGNSFNDMIEKIENLLEKVKSDEKNLHEAELELLQAQINPHFLYNTLDTIIWLAESGKQDGVVEMVSSLSNFFRTSLSHGNDIITLGEEERHVRSYLQIQQVRYQDILEYSIYFPEEIKNVQIPKITLQPLVENALYHGIKNKRGKGKIDIGIQLTNNSVIICIEDNGIGFTNERLNSIINMLNKDKKYIKNKKSESYGLYNVNERIKLKFGEGYGLSIKSVFGEGTCVKVKIPIC